MHYKKIKLGKRMFEISKIYLKMLKVKLMYFKK